MAFYNHAMKALWMFLSLLLACQIVLWGINIYNEKQLERLGGMPVDEAVTYMRNNKGKLNIKDVRRHSDSDFRNKSKEWLIVELRHVSILGIIISWVVPISPVEVTGLLYFSIDDDGSLGHVWAIH